MMGMYEQVAGSQDDRKVLCSALMQIRERLGVWREERERIQKRIAGIDASLESARGQSPAATETDETIFPGLVPQCCKITPTAAAKNSMMTDSNQGGSPGGSRREKTLKAATEITMTESQRSHPALLHRTPLPEIARAAIRIIARPAPSHHQGLAGRKDIGNPLAGSISPRFEDAAA